VTDLAVAATVQAAATRRAAQSHAALQSGAGRVDVRGGATPPADGGAGRSGRTLPAVAGVVERADLRQAVREARTANLVVLCVDASGSMERRTG